MKNLIRGLITDALQSLREAERWGDVVIQDFRVEHPQSEDHGDYAANIAMRLASVLRKNPLDIGTAIVEQMEKSGKTKKMFKRVEVVPPGFINFTIADEVLFDEVGQILDAKEAYGRAVKRKSEKIQVEFISANPTGPLHMGNGRGAFTGDCLANVLSAVGYNVRREYYLNDRGVQTEKLGDSVTRRWLQMQGVPVPYPEDAYQGEYVKELAAKLELRNYKLQNINKIERIKDSIKEKALAMMIAEIQDGVENKLKIKFHQWFSEKSLYENGDFERVMRHLRMHRLVYEKDDAVFLKSTQFGDDKDRVMVKRDGSETYLASDAAYMWNRFKTRKLDRVIMIVGADHIGFHSRMQAVAEAIGAKGKLEIIFMQLVRLLKDGKELRMSKRAGNFVTLDELVDAVGLDAARFFFLMNAPGNHMDFDMDLAVKKSNDNPVYYVQYAHARICQILSKAAKVMNAKRIRYDALQFSEDEETSLIRELMKFPELVEEIATTHEVYRLPFYATEVARKFHVFYTQHRVIDGENVDVNRLVLVQATKIVLKNALTLMGISAPMKM